MNADIEALYQEIGREASAVGVRLHGKLLVYAEVEDGSVSASLFYEKGPSGTVTFKYCPAHLQDLIYSLWETWTTHPGNSEWRAMAYLASDGKFSVDLVYPDQMDPDEDVPERRPRVIKKYFGDVKIDYSEPG